MRESVQFPENFLWGVSTSAHQVEGGNINDWSECEACHADRLASEASPHKDYGNGPLGQRFDTIAAEAQNSENYISGRGDAFESHWKHDFELARVMGMNAIRFSVEWSRVEPSPGVYDNDEIKRYQDMSIYAEDIGMKPFITLHHFTNPRWFQDAGGFERAESSDVFERYVQTVVPRIMTEDTSWLVINEPETYVGQGWLFGDWPPNKRNPVGLWRVHKNLIEAHKRGYEAIKSVDEDVPVSSAVNNIDFEPAGGLLYPLNKAAASVGDKLVNHRFHEATMDHQDFIALNQYMHCVIDGGLFKNDTEQPRSDLGWYLNPKSLYNTIRGVSRYGKPIIITEHGLADQADAQRSWYIQESLRYVHQAISEGIDVQGYMHWSLLDNFEWDKGYWPKFGLVAVDRQTMQRQPRASFEDYSRIAVTNGLVAD